MNKENMSRIERKIVEEKAVEKGRPQDEYFELMDMVARVCDFLKMNKADSVFFGPDLELDRFCIDRGSWLRPRKILKKLPFGVILEGTGNYVEIPYTNRDQVAEAHEELQRWLYK